MARSVGEAAALGLESGFIIGRNTQQMARDNARRDMLDQQNAEDRQMQRAAAAEQRARLLNQDKLSQAERTLKANEYERAESAGEVTRMEGAGVPIPAAQQLKLMREVNRRRKENAEAISILTGRDVSEADKEAGIDLTEFMPGPNGEPPARAAAVMQVARAIQSGDPQAALPGLNVLHGPSVKKVIGRPGKHGGTIIDAEIAKLELAPGSPTEDPQYIPMLKIMVGNEDGNPIGHYFAPATEGGSIEDDAKVLRFGLKDQAKLLDANMDLVQKMSSPDGQAAWKQARAKMGVVDPKPVVKEFTVTPGAKHVTQRRDPVTGKVLDESVIEGNPKQASGGALQQSVNAIKGLVEAGDLTEEEGRSLISMRVKKDATGTKAQGLSVGGGGGGKESAKEARAARKDDLEDRKLMMDEFELANKQIDNINKQAATLRGKLPQPPGRGETAGQDAAKVMADYEARVKPLKDRIDALEKDADAKQAALNERQAAYNKEQAERRQKTLADAGNGGGTGRTLAAPAKAPAGAKDFSSLWK